MSQLGSFKRGWEKKAGRAFGLILWLVVFGCKAENQKSREAFFEGEIPAVLSEMANETDALREKESEIVARVEREEAEKNTLQVAVIDNGVALAHPDLVDRIAFDVEDGKIVGAGHDFMGDDEFASPNLINPTLFAFGARAIQDGKIVGPHSDPLRLILELNSRFIEGFLEKIRSDEVLKDSLFQRLTPASLSLYGAHLMVVERGFELKKYKDAERLGHLISTDPGCREALIETHGVDYFFILEKPWLMSSSSGIPYFGNFEFSKGHFLMQLENADRFFELLQRSVEEFSAGSEYGSALARYIEYLDRRAFDYDTSSETKKKTAIEEIAKAHYYAFHGPLFQDPLRELSHVLDWLGYAQRILGGVSETAGSLLERSFAFADQVYEIGVSDPKLPLANRRTLRKLGKRLGAVRELQQWYLRERNWGGSGLGESKAASRANDPHYQYYLRLSHPYLSELSNEEAHGSHVSGIIAKQDPQIRIVPVRVTTRQVQIGKGERDQIKERFRKEIREWFQLPVVFRALQGILSGIIDGVEKKADTAEGRDELASELVELLREKIDLSFEEGVLDYVFLEEVIEAIGYVGKKRIKLANISLGTSFEKSPTRDAISKMSSIERLEHLFDFLKFELFKYKVGKTIQESASGTLFVVATGNDGKWVDGKSRSALPVEISSPFLAPYETAQEKVPNNHVSNVLAVGSLDPEFEVSGYTNIPINLRTPFILAEGENILSPIHTMNRRGLDGAVSETFPELQDIGFISLPSERYQALAKEEFGSSLGVVDQRKKSFIEHLYQTRLNVLRELSDAVMEHLFISFPTHRGRMSGTSMATPTVTGGIARMVMGKAKQLGVSPWELYDHPAFAPAVLVQDALAEARQAGGKVREIGVQLDKLTSSSKYETDDAGKSLEKFLESILEKGKERNSLKWDSPATLDILK